MGFAAIVFAMPAKNISPPWDPRLLSLRRHSFSSCTEKYIYFFWGEVEYLRQLPPSLPSSFSQRASLPMARMSSIEISPELMRRSSSPRKSKMYWKNISESVCMLCSLTLMGGAFGAFFKLRYEPYLEEVRLILTSAVFWKFEMLGGSKCAFS